MKKLTFERAILIVFILIILISTSDVTGKYIDKFINSFKNPIVSSEPSLNPGFPTMLMNADDLYKEGDYEAAADEYLAMTLNNTLSLEQKIHAYFRLGTCQFNLKKYEMATNSFTKVTGFDPDDSIAYNNAAVSAYRSKDMTKALELQKKALNVFPAVEYYFNLARMYEDNEEYKLAANNFLVVIKGEQNITEIEHIDPVRVKEKVARLQSNMKGSIVEAVNNVLIALKIKDTRDIFTINDNEMKLKQGDFVVQVLNLKNTKNIVAEYERERHDPYDLITELLWTVYKDGKVLYKSNSDKISVNASAGGNYEVKLNIKYNGNEEMASSKTVRIEENKSTIDNGTHNEVVASPTMEKTKYYSNSMYEQLFESDFKISSTGYRDDNGVLWGKDQFIGISYNNKLAADRSYSLTVKNNYDKDAGIWINLDSILKNQPIKGKVIRISFFASKITDNAEIFVNARVKTNNMIATTKEKFSIPAKFRRNSMTIYIPEDASGITVSIKTIANEQFNIDGFTVSYE